MNVGITGATGFLGEYVLELLVKQGFTCTLFDRTKYDLLKPETLEEFVLGKDVVIHLAGVNREADDIVKINVLGTMNLVQAMTKYVPMSRIIFASSFQVYLKDTLYGMSKKLAEEFIASNVSEFSIKTTILRISNVYGPGCKPFYNSAVATFAYQLKNGQTITINGDGSQKRDYVYVTDVADAFLNAVSYTPKTVTTFDICSGNQISIRDVIEKLKEISKKEVKVVYNKAVNADDWPIKKDYKNAEKGLNWRPKITIEEGLRAVLSE